MPGFEFDPNKSRTNKIKHGIDFIEAQWLWNGPVFEVGSAYPGEARNLVVGLIGEKHWTAIVTKRQSVVRIISVRRARIPEIEDYERSYPS